MPDHDMKVALFTVAIFGAGATALILYQHWTHTSAIVGAIGVRGAGAGTVPGAAAPQGMATGNASLAGTPAPSQENLIVPVMAQPYQAGPNWQLH